MEMDLVDRDDEFVGTVDLPGFDRDEMDLTVTDRTVRIRVEREEEATDEGERYLRQERRRASMYRSLRLPEAVDTEASSASMQHGVLTVTLPKVAADEDRSIDIE